MEFFKQNTRIDFLGYRRLAAIFSALLFCIALLSLWINGIQWGLDFTGGNVVEVHYAHAPNLETIRKRLDDNAFGDAVVQTLGAANHLLIRTAPHDGKTPQQVATLLTRLLALDDKSVKLLRTDAVGAQVGAELAEKGTLAVLIAMLCTGVYIALRFEYRFAIGAAVALAHDPIIIMGFFSLFRVEFDLQSLAAMLAVIGYSLNDTIVVFDRVKENLFKQRKASPYEVMNSALNQTLSRTIMTSLLTLLVVVSLLLFGGPTMFGFSLALLIGILVGTYSSIYIAGALAISLGLTRADLMPSTRHSVDERP